MIVPVTGDTDDVYENFASRNLCIYHVTIPLKQNGNVPAALAVTRYFLFVDFVWFSV
jgi:hypothetical protein